MVVKRHSFSILDSRPLTAYTYLMQWQDLVFFLGSWIFVVSMVPTIRGSQKPALATSLSTAIVLLIFAYTQVTLGLWLTAIATLATFIVWATLAFQRWKQK